MHASRGRDPVRSESRGNKCARRWRLRPAVFDSTQPDIYSADIKDPNGCSTDGLNGYLRNFSGTSASAPQVAGAAALLLSVDSSMTWQQVRGTILDNADYWGTPTVFGAGKLNIGSALHVYPIASVSISLPSKVKPYTTCGWTATVTGGNPGFTYRWYRNGQAVGQGQSVQVYSDDSNFTLRVDVTDQYGLTGTKSRSVTVTPTAPTCTQ
jgi:Subtilase family